MKAIVHTKYGSPDVLQIKEVDKPVPADNDVLIKIFATTVNRSDCAYRSAKLFINRFFTGLLRPGITTLGTEFSGQIEAVGEAVQSYKPGDPVFGLSAGKFGTHAEYLCLPEEQPFTIKPTNMTFEEAAAVCEGMLFAMNYLKRIDFKKPQKILINGATGSIGSAGLQLCKYFGAEVTAVGNTKNLELLKSLGADAVIDYLKEDFTKIDQQFDVVLDAVGKSSFFKCKKLLKPGGIYFSAELGFMSQNIFLSLWTLVFGSLPGQPSGTKVLFPIPRVSKKDIEFYKEIIEAGKYKAVIDRRYPLEQIAEAYRYVETGQKTGNVVITVVHNNSL